MQMIVGPMSIIIPQNKDFLDNDLLIHLFIYWLIYSIHTWIYHKKLSDLVIGNFLLWVEFLLDFVFWLSSVKVVTLIEICFSDISTSIFLSLVVILLSNKDLLHHPEVIGWTVLWSSID